jgi:hypothetical protein
MFWLFPTIRNTAISDAKQARATHSMFSASHLHGGICCDGNFVVFSIRRGRVNNNSVTEQIERAPVQNKFSASLARLPSHCEARVQDILS